MMRILLLILIVMFIPCQSWGVCQPDDPNCFVMTNDYNGTIYMAKTISGEWSTPIVVFEDNKVMNFVLRGDLLTMIFNTNYLKDGRYGIYMYRMIKDSKLLNEASLELSEYLAKKPEYQMGGNPKKMKFLLSVVRYDMDKKIEYNGGRWGYLYIDSYGKLIMMEPIPHDKEGQPFIKISEKIGKGIIEAFNREIKIAREKGQIP